MAIGIYGLLLALMAVMKFAPLSAAGRLLNRQLVELPLARFATMERHHLIFLLIAATLLLVGGEALFALGSADFALIYALDLSLYVDGLLAALALASLARGKAVALGVVAAGTRLRRVFGRRRVRGPAIRREQPSANDGEHPAAAWAA